MRNRQLDLDTGQFVFLSYARADKELIFRMGIVQRLAEAGFSVRVDNGETWGWDDETRPFVSPFVYGDAWEKQILEGASRSLCVLALCSRNTRKRLAEDGEEAWIAKELKAGRENGTLFAVSIDDQLGLTSQAEQDFWRNHLGVDFAKLQTGNLGVLLGNDAATGTRSLPQALDLLVGAVDLKMRQSLGRPRASTTLEATQVHRLLNCLDRVQPAGCVAENRGLHLAETDHLGAHLSFAARLALVDLPDEELCRRDGARRHIDCTRRHYELVRGCILLDAEGKLVPFAREVFEAYWRDDQDISRDEVLADISDRLNLDQDSFFIGIAQPAIKDKLRANTDELMERGGFISPTIYRDREDMYFGNDRLPLLRAALERRASSAS